MFSPEQTIAEVARIAPGAIDVFEEAEIDFSCRGAQSLAEAARNSGYRVEDIIGRLRQAGSRDRNWFAETLTALMARLIDDHAHLTDVLIPGVTKALAAGTSLSDRRDVDRMQVLFEKLADEMTTHVQKEEVELFPYIRDLENAGNGSVPVMRISQRVLRELIEHESYRDTLDKLSVLSDRLPAGALADGVRREVREFRRHVHEHMHLENNVLYPRAIEIENALRRSALQG
jgi:regulator of cell morphogenesis and NO signaling